jgi:hypothetical protein
LNDVLSTFPPDPVALPGPFGWDPSPPAVFTRHIEGTDLYHLVQDPDHEAWAATQWSPEELAGLCGRALGTFHSFMEPVPGPAGMDVLHEATRAVYLSGATVRDLERHVAIAPSFGDFGIHQFRLGTDDVLYLLDPPTIIDLAPVHRDIASFAFHVTKVIETRSLGERRHSATDLCEAFYAGYSETGPTDLRIPVNRWLVTIFAGRAARGLAHKRLRSGEPVLALRNTELWLRAIARAHLRKPYFQ